jgi:phosphatidate cytidylyltransferase
MALDKQVFRTRAITALVFVAVMLLGLFTNLWSFIILFSIVHIGCWWEYLLLIEKIHTAYVDRFIKYFLIVCGFTIIWVLGMVHSSTDIGIKIFSVNISFKLVCWILQGLSFYLFVARNKEISSGAAWMIFSGFIYITLPITLIISLRDMFSYTVNDIDIGLLLPCAIIFSIWTNDTMAYIVGSFIGKTPFSKISPKKTWEGTGGGAVLCVIVIAILGAVLPKANQIPVYHWIAIAAICAVFGTMGDLLESKIKRMANVKDSGSFMPGHGGFLDRFDSLLIATPMVWVYVKAFL